MKKSIIALQAQMKALEERIIKIREKCEHNSIDKKYGCNIGNYDPGSDCYWCDYTCLDCGKRWREDTTPSR